MTVTTPSAEAITAWMAQEPEQSYKVALSQLIEGVSAGQNEAIELAKTMFNDRLAFGTAGLRGPLRPGPNGINRIVVCQTTAGFAEYLLANRSKAVYETIRVIIGFDGRHQSDVFARDVAEVFSGHGIQATQLSSNLPTPVLAFAVRELNVDAGVMITASHNPATDNGYKVYLGGDDGGSQIIPPVDANIEAHIQRVAHTETWSTIRFLFAIARCIAWLMTHRFRSGS